MADSSASPSALSTPTDRVFTATGDTAEERLKAQTVGLVQLADFRKRRAEAAERTDQGSRDGTPAPLAAVTVPSGRETAATPALKKKRKKTAPKAVLSFAGDDDDDQKDGQDISSTAATSTAVSRSQTPATPTSEAEDATLAAPAVTTKKRLRPNTAISNAPKALTKPALLREAALKESLRKEYLQVQEAVKQTEFVLPFVFFDGKDIAGGRCRMKKGDFVWLFLERARKRGADLAGRGEVSKKDWARTGLDDLMLVRGHLIIPHQYDFHHFILHRPVGYNNQPIFPHSAQPTSATPKHLLPASSGYSAPRSDEPVKLLSTAADRREAAANAIPDAELEGFTDDPSQTKVVDRRWYERNKHIYPASVWEEFDPTRDYSTGVRKDAEGNAFFLLR